MKNKRIAWQISGFVFTGIMGVLLHFLFEWTGESIFVAPFSAINESIWEHMKLLFFPMFVYALVQSLSFDKENDGYWCVKLFGIVLGTMLIPVVYYTINGVFGQTPDFVNIAIFFVASAIAYFAEWGVFKYTWIKCNSPQIALFILILIAILFTVWTFIPPCLPLFRDPLTNACGYFKVLY